MNILRVNFTSSNLCYIGVIGCSNVKSPHIIEHHEIFKEIAPKLKSLEAVQITFCHVIVAIMHLCV